MVLERLSAKDRYMFGKYIDNYAGGEHTASVEHILRYWDQAKDVRLAKMFGDKLILQKRVEFKKSADQMIGDMEQVLSQSWSGKFNDEAADFYRNFRNFMQDEIERQYGRRSEEWYTINNLTDYYTLCTNSYNCGQPLHITLPDGKVMKITKGYKATKAIGKLAEAFHIEGFEEFRIAHSQVLNQKKLAGNLCLSIHPLDYATMSDNECGWESCMSWQNEGCYRQGTVEMMNSECVVVAYLTSDSDMWMPGTYDGQDCRWNSKKWRQLFIVTPELICNVKAYPYSNDELTHAVNEWLVELAEQAGIGEYTKNDMKFYPWNSQHNDELDIDVYIDPCTGYMYNDFSSNREDQFARIGKAFRTDGKRFTIEYSGTEECMICGCSGGDYDGNEGSLGCESCSPNWFCDDCGDRYDRDDLYELDGGLYCEYCYDNHAVNDFITGDAHHDENCVEVHIGAEDPEKISGISFCVYGNGRYGDDLIEYLTKVLKPYGELKFRFGRWGERKYYIPFASINRENDNFLDQLNDCGCGYYHDWEEFDNSIKGFEGYDLPEEAPQV